MAGDKAANLRWREKNRERYLDQKRAHHFELKYGITRRQRDELWQAQDCKCAVCQRPLPEPGFVDHDHVTGKIRGLLCTTCNVGIGMLQDNPEVLKNAIRYLEAENE